MEVYNLCEPDFRPVGGKFIVLRTLYGQAKTLVLFSQDPWHRDIAVRWQQRTGVLLHDAGLRVTGGGRWRLEEDGEQLRLYGESSAYGGFDASALQADWPTNGPVFNERRIVFGE